jgi:hypothetical protein
MWIDMDILDMEGMVEYESGWNKEDSNVDTH